MAVEPVAEDIHRIEIPLPHTPLRITNAYLIRGGERNLLVDTGFNCEESREALDAALRELRVDLRSTDIFCTHMHADHSGLAGHFRAPESRVYMSRADGELVKSCDWSGMAAFFALSGLLANGVAADVNQHPGHGYAAPTGTAVTFVEDGHEFAAGRYRLRCVETKGHSPGHMCLYDPGKRILFSGDHILGKITPNITIHDFSTDALADYLRSLDAVARLAVDVVFPGHRDIVRDCKTRIEELHHHHERRLEEIMRIIGDQTLNAADVARRMQWSLSIRRWDDFPPAQKLFSAGEALAHLYHLVNRGNLSLTMRDSTARFSRAPRHPAGNNRFTATK